jgi:polyisoprenoid-binding protein YceI
MTKPTRFRPAIVGAACGALTFAALAAPVTYNIESNHPFPAVRADLGGASTFTGRINGTTGTITLDKEAGTGSVDITMDMTTVDFGIDALDDHVKRDANMFDTTKYPTATYSGKLVDFKDGAPTAVDGSLTWRGVTKPVRLTIERFRCAAGRGGRETCGADATGTFSRADFGANYGAPNFDMNVKLLIQIEAAAAG